MSFSFNKSSLLASVEILKDKNFKKYKDLNYIESQKTTLDIKNGKKIIDTIGIKLIQKYNKHGFSVEDNLETLAKFRGIQAKCKYAEAFQIIKQVK